MKNYLSILFIFLTIQVFSQNLSAEKYTIKGQMLDESKKPISFGNAAVYSQKDSILVTGAISDEAGNFVASVSPGIYFVKLTYVSYEKKIISDVVVKSDDVNLGPIRLSENTDLLQEVVVEGQKTQMQLELDKRVFNVSEDPNNISRNASDVLDNLPSVSVDVEGNVSLRGNENVQILIDGKPSGMLGINGTDGLRQIQGNIIEKVEVITNPSSKFQAEGTAGIINLVLKKDQKKGLNGAFTGNIGYPTEYGISGNVNYRKGRFNIFGNYGLDYGKRPGGGHSYQEFANQDTSYITRSFNDRNRGGLANSFRIGTDINITDNDIITAAGMIRISDEENITDIFYEDYNSLDELVRNTKRHEVEIEDDDNFQYQLMYKKILPGKDHELTVELQYQDNTEVEDSKMEETDLLISETPSRFQRSLNQEGDKNFLAQADYTYPITENKKIEAGYRGSIREITSDYNVDSLNKADEWVSLEGFSNRFVYDENVQAAYATFENKMDKWGYKLGVRFENTAISTYQRETDETNERNYLNLFPSIFLSYKLDEKNTVQTSYSRRISRPRFWHLNPFYSYTDPRNIRSGNPYLDPEYTDSYELGFLSNHDKTSLYGGIYYRHTTGQIQRVRHVEYLPGDSLGTTFAIPYNIGIENAMGLEGNFSYDVTNWLMVNGNANLYRSIIDGKYEGTDLSRDIYTAQFHMAIKAKVNDFDFQLRGRYRAPETRTQGTRKSFYTVDFGANYRILNGRGTFNLNARDLFNTRKYRGTTQLENFYSEDEFQWRSRQITLSFTYQINPKRQRNSEREGSGEGGDYNNGGGDMEF